jgi:hypothetical protein
MTNSRHDRFRRDMEDAGHEVRDYSGRSYYRGPAVVVPSDELQGVIRATEVRVQTDNMEKSSLVVYPA